MAQERLGVVRDLVEGLFAYARLAAAAEDDAGQTDVSAEPVPVLAAVEEALAAQYPAFVERGWCPRVDFADEDLCLRASREDVARVFANLTANALRHGSAAPNVVQRGRRVVFSNPVENPAAIEADRLFERFYQGRGSTAGAGGGRPWPRHREAAVRRDGRGRLGVCRGRRARYRAAAAVSTFVDCDRDKTKKITLPAILAPLPKGFAFCSARLLSTMGSRTFRAKSDGRVRDGAYRRDAAWQGK